MHLSIKETAAILKLSEKSVRKFIESGILAAERVGRRVLVRRESLESLLAKGLPAGLEPSGAEILQVPGNGPHLSDKLETILGRMMGLEKQVENLSSLIHEKKHDLLQELRERDALLAQKEVELEKLRRDLVYQQRICEKEIEHHRNHYEEQFVRSKEEISEKLALERHHFEEKLAAENARWSERLSREQENFYLELSKMKEREGFWAKLVKMMTWS